MLGKKSSVEVGWRGVGGGPHTGENLLVTCVDTLILFIFIFFFKEADLKQLLELLASLRDSKHVFNWHSRTSSREGKHLTQNLITLTQKLIPHLRSTWMGGNGNDDTHLILTFVGNRPHL